MSEGDKNAYVDYRLATAREFLTDARTLIGTGSLKNAANRLYYSIFQPEK